MSTCERTWTEIGAELFDRDLADRQGHNWAAGRPAVEQAMAEIEWEDVPADGVIRGPMSPVLVLKELIEQLNLPRVTRYAYNAAIPTRSCEGSNCYGLLAVECNYKDGRCIVYAADRGTDALVLASDFYRGEVVG